MDNHKSRRLYKESHTSESAATTDEAHLATDGVLQSGSEGGEIMRHGEGRTGWQQEGQELGELYTVCRREQKDFPR